MAEKIPQFGVVEGIPWCAGKVETALDRLIFFSQILAYCPGSVQGRSLCSSFGALQ